MSEHLAPERRPAQPVLTATSQAAFKRRAEIRRRLRHTNTDLRTLLSEHTTHPDLGTLTIESALADLPGFGRATVRAVLKDLSIDGSRRMRSLRPRETYALINRLDPPNT